MSKKKIQKSPASARNRTGKKRSNVPIGVPLNDFSRWMRDQKIEVEVVAKKLRLSVSSIYGYRRGNRPPSRATAKLIEKMTKRKVLAGSWD